MTDEAKAKPKCGAVGKRSGKPCQHPAGFRTDHAGTGRCWLHGGNSRTHQEPNLRHGIYAAILPADELDAADNMAGSIRSELAVARVQFARISKQLEECGWSPPLVIGKHETKTLAVESMDERQEDKAEQLRRDAKKCGEYYDPADGDFGLADEGQPLEVKATRVPQDWIDRWFRLFNLIPRLEQQLQNADEKKLSIEKLRRESGDGVQPADTLSDDELDSAFSSIIRR